MNNFQCDVDKIISCKNIVNGMDRDSNTNIITTQLQNYPISLIV